MPGDTPIPDIAESYNALSAAAADLNAASDALGKSVTAIDTVFQKLNLGVTAWVEVERHTDFDQSFTAVELGYSKLGGKWGVALRTIEGYEYREDARIEEWLFNEAPRRLRVEAIDKLPKLLDGLLKEAKRITERIKTQIGPAEQLAQTLHDAALESALKAKATKAVVELDHKRQVSKAHPPIRPVTGGRP